MNLFKWLLALLATSSQTTPAGEEADERSIFDPWG
jgi:hypothetical protein